MRVGGVRKIAKLCRWRCSGTHPLLLLLRRVNRIEKFCRFPREWFLSSRRFVFTMFNTMSIQNAVQHDQFVGIGIAACVRLSERVCLDEFDVR